MLRISLMLRAVSLAGLGFACLAPVALAANATLPGAVTSYATIQCAGVATAVLVLLRSNSAPMTVLKNISWGVP